MAGNPSPLPTLSIHDVDPEEVVGRRKSPYDDPELDDNQMVDVTPLKKAAE
jgi:hypothetical protein